MTDKAAEKWKKEIKAFNEGQTIQIHAHESVWLDISDPSWNLDSEYRIKDKVIVKACKGKGGRRLS